ncbi:MAG: DUF1573 domain-containing protein, partial [Chitinophagia bacterium]|nr:DUF1573 domain-containing protein [Chitinophagia bacterium]
MKKLFVLLLSIACFSVASYAKKGEPGAVLKFKGGDTHDFGKVKKGPIVHCTFEFTNVGRDTLYIKDINPSCGCTNVDWDKQPIAPGKKGHIKAGLRTSEQHGAFFKDIYIQSNAANAAADKKI